MDGAALGLGLRGCELQERIMVAVGVRILGSVGLALAKHVRILDQRGPGIAEGLSRLGGRPDPGRFRCLPAEVRGEYRPAVGRDRLEEFRLSLGVAVEPRHGDAEDRRHT